MRDATKLYSVFCFINFNGPGRLRKLRCIENITIKESDAYAEMLIGSIQYQGYLKLGIYVRNCEKTLFGLGKSCVSCSTEIHRSTAASTRHCNEFLEIVY